MFLNPTFYNLTHLDIVDLPGRKPRWNQWDVLARLPKLSHLSLYDLHIAKHCVIHCKGLKVLIFLRYKMTWLKDIPD
ncbi:hypothetical protein CPB84DRAFT_1803872 [Gymnopilus junonius]|uniref:Uncharacterized protein n=1 Tax=Gymnopilus junonius TaxID=109634 RepID=A0A9P5TEI6_GYMJU|nr:hypothetical protein CPB84DRAFT_1803872 [Gymnopilus junonius]